MDKHMRIVDKGQTVGGGPIFMNWRWMWGRKTQANKDDSLNKDKIHTQVEFFARKNIL